MDIKEILSKCDHTLLAVDCTWDQIRAICDDAMKYGTASACIPPSFVARAKEYTGGRTRICTVIGFPNGYSTAPVKAYEAADAVKNGADELDMVINVGMLKEGNTEGVLDEIKQVRKACEGKILKVIIETCLLTDDEIKTMCDLVVQAGADYIKTSTGFSKEGATFHAVELMKKGVGDKAKVKAAGGISTLEDAQKFIELGADRLGTSRVVKIVKAQEA